MNHIEIFNDIATEVHKLDGQIDATTPEEFITQWQRVFSCAIAKNTRRVVYVWSTVKPIPRLSGESDIVYVGKTDQTLYDRHYRYAKVEGSSVNWKRYKHIIQNFGPISFHCARTEDHKPREVEKEMIHAYFEKHLEVPPVNAGS